MGRGPSKWPSGGESSFIHMHVADIFPNTYIMHAFFFSSHHLVARVYESKAEFRSALQHEKEGYTIYKNQVGPEGLLGTGTLFFFSGDEVISSIFMFSTQMGEAHEKTKESSEYLKYLTQQAVALQRTMNEIYKNGSNASIMPLKVTAPSLDMLLSFHLFHLHHSAVMLCCYFLLYSSSPLPAWPVSWSSSTLSTASSLSHSGKVRNP